VHLSEGVEPGTFVQARVHAAGPHHLLGRVVASPEAVAV
jgi:hypothetical protein